MKGSDGCGVCLNQHDPRHTLCHRCYLVLTDLKLQQSPQPKVVSCWEARLRMTFLGETEKHLILLVLSNPYDYQRRPSALTSGQSNFNQGKRHRWFNKCTSTATSSTVLAETPTQHTRKATLAHMSVIHELYTSQRKTVHCGRAQRDDIHKQIRILIMTTKLL